jgi:selenocysteine-specific elongation factor
LPSHAVTLDARETALAARLRPLLAQGRYDPPWVRDLAREMREDEETVRSLLRKLARLGELYQVVRDLFYEREVVHELARLVANAAAEQGGTLTAAAFRDATGLGRKRAIQILEFFDRVGYTRFHRERHVLRPDSRLREVL